MNSSRSEHADAVLEVLRAALRLLLKAFKIPPFTSLKLLTRAIRSVICSLALSTFTVNVQKLVTPPMLITRLVTVVVPMANRLPLVRELVTLYPLQLSVTTGAGNETLTPLGETAFVVTLGG